MNIFYLDHNPYVAAQYHSDKHVVKMILESAQLLSTAHRVMDEHVPEIMYKATHKNHPCSIWVRQHVDNYDYVYRLFEGLHDEYQFRYGCDKIHKTFEKLKEVLRHPPKAMEQADCKPSSPARAMPEEFLDPDGCTVTSYRNYYKYGKSAQITAFNKARQAPEWMGQI